METKEFLERALGENGYYCIFASRATDGRRIQKFFDSIDVLLTSAEQLDNEGYDTYFALSTFKDTSSRKAKNANELRSFFLDIDCGPNKDYPDKVAAIAALRDFCEKTELPTPTLISSGGGLHVYWFLTKPVSVGDWVPIAEQLKVTCVKHNLLADPAVTADSARVLRIPTTHNYKSDPPSEVFYISRSLTKPHELEVIAEYICDTSIPVPTKYTPSDSNAVIDRLIGNRINVFKDIVLKTQSGVGCEQLGHILTSQEEISEPLWRAGLSIAKFCEDSDHAARRISEKHPDFDLHDTMYKLDRIKGPYLCARFDEYNPNICTECSHWGKIKSPINLGSKIRKATEEDNILEDPTSDLDFLADKPATKYKVPSYPDPYFRGANGGIYMRTMTKDGDPIEKQLYHNDLYVVRRIWDDEVGESIMMRLHLPQDALREFTIPLSTVNSRDKFRDEMSKWGISVIKPVKMEDIMDYTNSWVNHLQASGVADAAHKQFGWTSDDCTSFILGNKEIFHDHVDFNPPSSQTMALFPAFEPKGTLEGWKATMDFYNREDFEIHQFVVGTAFGSVLMGLSPINCAALHLHSKESGVGKTTAMAAAATAWGDSEELIMVQEDTYNTKMHRGEIYHNLPLYIDELTEAKPTELSNLVYQLTGGKQRGRLISGGNAERYRGAPWRMLAVTTGNTSVIERINMAKSMPKAEAMRILEVKVDRMFKKSEDKNVQDNFIEDIKNNYGHAGQIYIQYVLSNMDMVKKLISTIRIRVDVESDLTSENRFWSAFATNTLAGVILAKKAGLLDYDVKALFKWTIALLRKRKGYVDDMDSSAEETLNDYIHEHWSNVLWIKSTDDLRKNDGSGLDSLIVPEALPRGQLVARYETDLKKAYLIPKPLRIWCGEQQINYAAFVEDLIANMGAKKMKMRLSKGTHMQLPPTDVIVVNCHVEEAGAERGSED